MKLLSRNPFPDRPPTFVRARLYLYRFATRYERRHTGSWWVRELVGDYLPALGLDRPRAAPQADQSTQPA
jgi:hypothetical protein